MDRLAVSFLLLLLCSSSFGAELQQTTAKSDLPEQTEPVSESVNVGQSCPCPPDVHALLRDLSVKLAENRLMIQQLQKENGEQTLKIEQLQTENRLMVQQLQKENQEQTLKIEQLQTETKGQTAKLTEFENHVDSQQQELRSLKSRTSETENQVETLRRDREVSRVAFSACLLDSGSGNTGVFSAHTTLVYRHVISNIGNAYNKHTGIFTAPVRGAYHFHFYIIAYSDSFNSAVRLEKNGELVVSARENQPNAFGTAGNGVSLLLEAGDVVFLRLWSGYSSYDDQNHHSTFSGRLLFTL